ncbi:MAG TPA: 4Fe-4S dicluster domain-containing protein [Chlorobaculum sp.]|nr:4Fe-4S dicluster domain-containing protein [Chlorobaculum sp.]
MKQIVWKHYRRTVEILQAILLTGLPFIRINGESAFRFDIRELNLYFFGTIIRIDELYLMLAAILFLLLLITLVTMIFGRVWCGWLCPQTVLLDLTDELSGLLGHKHRKFILKIVLVPVSALISMTMIWYFVPPADALAALSSSPVITGFFFVLWLLVYLELAFLGRRFCTSVCPYSMMQNALFDSKTLVIEYDQSRDATCMKCDDCVRACPVGIDIKKGLSSSCIACAECIDACYVKSSRRNLPPFPNYKGTIVRAKTVWMGGVTAAAALVLMLLISMRPPVSFVLNRIQEPLPKGLNRYAYTILNNTGKSLELRLSAPDEVTIIGERTIMVKPYGALKNRVLIKSSEGHDRVRLTLEGKGISISKEAGFL